MNNIVDEKTPHFPITNIVPMKFIEVGEGFGKISTIAYEQFTGPMGKVHGGFTSTILDSCMGGALRTMLKYNENFNTIDLNVKFLKVVPCNKELIAESRVIHLSKRLGMCEGTLKDTENILYAHATATFMIDR
jgi:uncharacterized protein (TIGR00369 family)